MIRPILVVGQGPAQTADEVRAGQLVALGHLPEAGNPAEVAEPGGIQGCEVGLRRRGPYDELLREFHCGYGFIFDILMDLGGWRDLHRHRRCQQIRQEFTPVHGYETPDLLNEAGVAQQYRAAMDVVRELVESAADRTCCCWFIARCGKRGTVPALASPAAAAEENFCRRGLLQHCRPPRSYGELRDSDDPV